MKKTLFVSALLFSIQVALSAYVNSTIAKNIIGEKLVGIVYIISSIITVFALHIAPKVINRIGRKYTLYTSLFLGILGGALLITFYPSLFSLLGLLILLITNTLTYFILDVILEEFSDDKTTGKTRGAYLSIMNIGWMVAPLIAGIIVDTFPIQILYGFVSLIIALVAIIMMIRLKNYTGTGYERSTLKETFLDVWRNKKIRIITLTNFMLQLFFSFMVIYSSLFLIEYYRLEWSQIGIIFTIMLSAFVLTEYPVGRLIDSGYKNYSVIALGLLLAGIGSILFVNVHTIPIVIGLILFVSRVGAAMIESASEVTLFKEINENNASVISFYRDMTPLAYIIGPTIAMIIVKAYNIKTLFILLGIAMILWSLIILINKNTLNEKQQ